MEEHRNLRKMKEVDLFKHLNTEQQEAVQTTNGPLLVLAGAGSGKTRVVISRIAYLLQQGVPASKILGLTFTNKAAQEMRDRIKSLSNNDVLISTFHSLGARLLRESIQVLGYRRSFTIYDDEDSDKLILSCINAESAAEAKTQLKTIKHYISNAKNNLAELDPNEFPYCYEIFVRYQDKLQEFHAVDFDDLLYLPVKILREFPGVRAFYQERWSHLLIDEYQDTNNAQYALVQALLGPEQHLCVVGDPDQSIYSWRGANIKNILNFEKDYPHAKVIRLEQNYRSRSNILEGANALISNNEMRYEKNLWSGRGEGDKIKVFTAGTSHDEAEFVARQLKEVHETHGVPWNRMVVFYRTHALSRSFEDLFYLKHIPYLIMGGISFYQRREVKDILSILKMVQSDSDFLAFSRSINFPKRGIGQATLERMHRNASEEKMAIFDYCQAVLDNAPLRTTLRLNVKQREGLLSYVKMIQELREREPDIPLEKLVQMAIYVSEYFEYLREDKDTEDERKANLESLIAKAAEWHLSAEDPSLAAFLEELSLKSALDEEDNSKERVHLMTIHNGKGLEYDTVFIVGLEEELFPHSRSVESSLDVEEERRLCYVGMTRAKERLFLSHVIERFVWGAFKFHLPSRFLKEIPSKYTERVQKRRPLNNF